VTAARYPKGLQSRSKRLWMAVTDGWDLDPHELLLLEEAALLPSGPEGLKG